MGPNSIIGFNSKKIIFFLFIYYLCIDKILKLIGFLTGYNIFERISIARGLISLEHIVLALTLLLILSKTISIKQYMTFGTRCAFCLFIWISVVALLWFYEIVIVQGLFGYYYSYTTSLVLIFVFLLIGLNIHLIDDLFQIRTTKRVFYTVVIIYFAMIIVTAVTNPLAGADSWYLHGLNRSGSYDYICYLDFSDSSALLLLFIISRMRRLDAKLLIMLMGGFMLFITSSRTAFMSYIFACSIAYIIRIVKGDFWKNAFYIVAIILLFYIVRMYEPSSIVKSVLPESHRFHLDIGDIESTRGYMQRMHWLKFGLRELEKHWVIGQYMSDVLRGTPGSYIHNWLSFWDFFGLGPFLLSIFIMIFVMYKTTVLFIHDTDSAIKEFIFMCSILTIMSVIVGRSYGYLYIWLALSTFPMIHDRVSSQRRSIRKIQKIGKPLPRRRQFSRTP